MKSVLISIQPKWCELIALGKKTVEVRKTRPKIDTPFKCCIYCTQGDALWVLNKSNRAFTEKFATIINAKDVGGATKANGKVIGEFVCDCIANYEAELWDDETYERIQEFFEPDDFAEYGEYEYKTVADNSDDFWRDNRLCNSSCLTIEELRKYVGTGIATFYGWGISDLAIYDKPKELCEFWHKGGIFNSKCDNIDDLKVVGTEVYKPLKRPPQSWCYVELLKGGAE